MNDADSVTAKPRYVWPWFVLAAFLLGLALAVLWLSVAVRHAEEQRAVNLPWTENPANTTPGAIIRGTNTPAPPDRAANRRPTR